VELVEHHIRVARTARYWTAGNPAATDVWFVLHGYRQLAKRFLRRFEAIASDRRLVVAPEALSRFYVSSGGGRHGVESVVGATWMTREDRDAEIADYVGYLDRLAARIGDGRGDARSISVLGFSQGVATACRWAVLGSIRPGRLILWGDFLPPDLDLVEARRRLVGVDVVLVRGSGDGALSPALAEAESARIDAAALDVRRVVYSGGHDIHRETLEALADDRP